MRKSQKRILWKIVKKKSLPSNVSETRLEKKFFFFFIVKRYIEKFSIRNIVNTTVQSI
jgi:hypothetical protein